MSRALGPSSVPWVRSILPAFPKVPVQLRPRPLSVAVKVVAQVQHPVCLASAGGLGENKLVRVN